MKIIHFLLSFVMIGVALAAPIMTNITEVVMVLTSTQEVPMVLGSTQDVILGFNPEVFLSTTQEVPVVLDSTGEVPSMVTASPTVNELEPRAYFNPYEVPGESAAISANDWFGFEFTHTEPASSTPPYHSSYLYGPMPYTISSTLTVAKDYLSQKPTRWGFTIRSSTLTTKPPKDRATVARTTPYVVTMVGEFASTSSWTPYNVLLSFPGAEGTYSLEPSLIPATNVPSETSRLTHTPRVTYSNPYRPVMVPKPADPPVD